MSMLRQNFPVRRLTFLTILLGGLNLPCPQPTDAQTPAPAKEAESLEEIVHQARTTSPADKIAPTMSSTLADSAHSEMLNKLYSAELMRPLSDRFDRMVPGGFKAALAHAREAGLPESLLAEIETVRAMFDVNFPAFVAAAARMEASRPNWKETASMFNTQREFDIYLALVRGAVARERSAPGSFAQAAMRMRKRDIARAVYNDLRMVDGCTDMYCIENNVRFGGTIPVDAWLAKVNPKTHLAINKGTDVTGQPFGPQRAGTMPAVPEATYKAVADAVPDDFWKPYRIPTVATAQR